MMRAAIYVRVSSERQRDQHTIEPSCALPECVRVHGWTLVGTYVDDSRSARTRKLEARDGFARLSRAAAAGELDVVAVIDIDRLMRTEDMRERAEILRRVPARGRVDRDA